MLAEPLRAAVESIDDRGKTVYLSPHGKKWSDGLARAWAEQAGTITLIVGVMAAWTRGFSIPMCTRKSLWVIRAEWR